MVNLFLSCRKIHQDQKTKYRGWAHNRVQVYCGFPLYQRPIFEQLRSCPQQQRMRTVFKSETSLKSHLVRPKDAVEPAKQDSVVYRIPCECGKVYILLARLEDLWKKESMSEASDLLVPRPPLFQNTLTTHDMIVILIGTRVGSKRRFT